MPGFSESCVSNAHSECHNRECYCPCHPWVQDSMRGSLQRTEGRSAVSTMVCPKCARVPRIGDTFCRGDGARLMAGKQCQCGKAAEPDDVFCGGCGQKFGAAAVPVPELTEEEIAALEAKARTRPSDVESPVVEVH